MNRQFVVVGLGRLGISMVATLDSLGQEVLARTMASPVLLDYVDLGEDEAVIEAQVPSAWLHKSLSELNLSQKIGLTVLALKPKGGPGTLPHRDSVLHDGDVLVVGGTRKDLDSSPLVQPDG
jgi:trk system potassium uptake protein